MGTTEFERRAATWSGWVFFGAVLLIVIGFLNLIQGLVALAKDEVFLVGESGLLVVGDFTSWGIALVIGGVILILAGAGLMSGREWARWLGIILVVGNLIAQFAFFPAFPLWSLIVISLNAAVLFGLTARWRQAKFELAG
jgi:hypothetical protein